MHDEKNVEVFYDNASKGYEDHDDRLCDKILEHFIIENLPCDVKLRILDAGGGTGRFSEALLNKGHELVLSDISEGMLVRAKQRLYQYSTISFVKESIIDMHNHGDESFDVVIMMNSILDYCGNYALAIKEAYRILKKGGTFIGSVNNRFYYCKTHELLTEEYDLFEKNMKTGDRYIVWGGQEKGHISHEFTLEELKLTLKNLNFRINKILGVFNLLDKYDLENVKNKERFLKIQIEYASKDKYINNSQDFFFVAQK